MPTYSSSNPTPEIVFSQMCINCSWNKDDHNGEFFNKWQNEHGYFHPEKTEEKFRKEFSDLACCPGFYPMLEQDFENLCTVCGYRKESHIDYIQKSNNMSQKQKDFCILTIKKQYSELANCPGFKSR